MSATCDVSSLAMVTMKTDLTSRDYVQRMHTRCTKYQVNRMHCVEGRRKVPYLPSTFDFLLTIEASSKKSHTNT